MNRFREYVREFEGGKGARLIEAAQQAARDADPARCETCAAWATILADGGKATGMGICESERSQYRHSQTQGDVSCGEWEAKT